MKRKWLQHTVLRAASLLAPGDQRADWLDEWHSELWYIPERGATRFCLGAFRDALWVRRNDLNPSNRSRSLLESPASCLAFLAVLAGVSLLIAACLLTPLRWQTTLWRLRPRDLPAACTLMLMHTGLILPVTRSVMGPATTADYPSPWRSRLRRGAFLALKIALVQPLMLCGLFAQILVGRLLPIAAPLVMCSTWILTCRWLILDQRRRCPVCLRLLMNPVRIGTPSRSFLDWYGAESMCSRGHGLLHVPETSASYSGPRQWLRLDCSWSGLFSRAAGARHG